MTARTVTPLRVALALLAAAVLVAGVLIVGKASGLFKAAETTARLLTAVECSQGNQEACGAAAASDRDRCDRGDAQGCVLLGIRAQKADGAQAEAEPGAALRYFQRACDLRDANGCWYLGNAHAYGRGTAKDAAKALEAYQRGCDLGGDVNVCDALGDVYQHGRGVPVDKPRALAIYDRGCSFAKPGARGFVCEHAARTRKELEDAR